MNDGSSDRSAALLREQFEKRPDVTRVILFTSNFGQHRAIMAGFAYMPRAFRHHPGCRSAESAGGDSRQWSPQFDAGDDYVGTIRQTATMRLVPLRIGAVEPHSRAHHAYPA